MFAHPPVPRTPLIARPVCFSARALLIVAGLLGCGSGNGSSLPQPPAAPVAPLPTSTEEEITGLLEQGEFAGAEARLRGLLEASPGSAELCTLLCETLRLSGAFDEAVEWGERAVANAPQSSRAQHQYARALAETMRTGGMLGALGKLGPFKSALETAIELDPTNLDARIDQVAFLLLAPGIAGGDDERGLTLAREVAELDPERGIPLVMWGLREDDRVDEAIAAGRAAVDELPQSAYLKLNLARLLTEEERSEEADRLLAEILETGRSSGKNETYYAALYQYGKLRVAEERDAAEAATAFEEYLAEAPPRGDDLPGHAGAAWRLGQARELAGDREAAREAYRLALEHDADFENASEALEELGTR